MLCDRAVDVVVSQGHVIPLVRAQLLERDLHRRAIQLAAVVWQHSLDLAVKEQNVVPGSRVRLETRLTLRHVRHGENSDIELVEANPFRVAIDHLDPKLTEEAQDTPGFPGAGRVMIARDHDYPRLG